MASEVLYINNIDKCVDEILDTYYKERLIDEKTNNNLISIEYILNNFETILNIIDIIVLESINNFNIKDTVQEEYIYIYNTLKDYVLLYVFFNLIIYNELNNILILFNKLNNKYKLDFFNNKYLVQYATYYKYITEFYLVFKNLSKIGLKTEDIPDLIFINKYKEIIEIIKKFDNMII